MLFMVSAATQSYTCSMLALTITLFLYAGSIGSHGGVFATKRFGSRLLYLCGLGVLILLALLMCTKLGHSVFGYGIPRASSAIIAIVLSVSYFVVTQIARYFMSPKGKKSKSETDEQTEEVEENGITISEKSLPEELFEEEEEEEENENNNLNERSNDND